MHSNPGRGRRRGGKRKSKSGAHGKPRRITLFGFDLFGRPPIQLPDDDAEDDEDEALLFRRHCHRSGSGSASTPPTTLTAQSFDPDAALLEISTIQEISVPQATEATEAEVKPLKEKEERRQRRKARKRLVQAGVVGDGKEFEGFQGSGGLALLKCPSGAGGGTTATSSSGSHSRSQLQSQSQESRGGFGHFVSAPPPAAEEDDEEADVDGSLCSRKKSTSGTHSNGGASDSRPNPSSLSRSTVEQEQGFFNLENELPIREEEGVHGRIGGGGFPVRGISAPGGGFPMTGFAGAKSVGGGGGKRSRDFGAFLARQGDEEEKGRVGDVDGVQVTYTPPQPRLLPIC